MAEQLHLDLLMQGQEAWNTWKQQNPTARPDLQGADLVHSHATFSGIDRCGS
jgi:hypothetical protein